MHASQTMSPARGRARSAFAALSFLAATAATSACNGPGENGVILGQDQVTGAPQPAPTQKSAPPLVASGDAPALGASCHGSDSSKLCLSLKYVVYANGGTPVISKTEALANLQSMNSIWSQCKIAFEFGEYVEADPRDHGLTFNTSSMGELTTIRNAYSANGELLVVTTGTWTGTLGAGAANAWTSMPGGGPYGVVLEAAVGNFGPIVAHELGHYLNLDHVGDTSDVMNAVIYSSSTQLTSSQCSAARAAATGYWSASLR